MSTRWLKANSHALLFLLVVVAGASVLALMYVRRVPAPETQAVPASPSLEQSTLAYANPASCSTCHEQIARTYSRTGMARAFSSVTPEVLAGLKSCATGTTGTTGTCLPSFVSVAQNRSPVSVAQDFSPANAGRRGRVYHKASDRYYTMVERGGRFYQRRHQLGFDGRETNVLELEAHYVIGSGRHARTFLHRTADGRLVQLPVSWYAERGGYWAMSPGYDKPTQLDFRRVIDAGCMSCHNGYPRAPIEDDLEGPRFPPSLAGSGPGSGVAGDSLPEGIDCQRCHGPGQAHVDAITAGDADAGRRAIVNPATLTRERQLETCMQCHLESTSSPLPFQIRRYEHPAFSFTPGQALGDYFIHFDHAPGRGRDDKFEIAGGAYRLRKSACFQRSEMTCVTCHDPHDIPRGPAAVARYVAICQSCHAKPHPGGTPRVEGVRTDATCLDCHMPKRRAEDAVHVVMTDHNIQRPTALRDLLAARTESQSEYRGEVVLYYPPALPSTPANELYLASAQVRQGSNLTAGIRRLQEAIERHRPARAEFYYELARAYATAGDRDADIRWCREALRRDPNFVPALKELGAAATAIGDFAEAARALEKAVALRPADANALSDLGSVYLRQNRLDPAHTTLQQALKLDPALPRAHNMMGLTALSRGADAVAETHFREAIRVQPDLAEAQNNLGNLLARRRSYAEAGYHFEKAIQSDPTHVEAHHSYGLILAMTKAYPRAAVELAAAVRLAPHLAAAHLDLAEVLVALGRGAEARAHFEAAARSADAEVRAAALAGLQAR